MSQTIWTRGAGVLTYGITPPKKDLPEERIREIGAAQCDRIRRLPIDALILYDICDEKDRNPEERPFPFLETIDPVEYSEKYLASLPVDRIIYRSVGKYSEDELLDFLRDSWESSRMTVFGGAASSGSAGLSLSRAYDLYAASGADVPLGGVLIPERHAKNFDEHLRVASKTRRGCRFFVSQAVYNVGAAKDFLSDYARYCQQEGITPAPVLFTLTPCGSEKTLLFMRWLGIAIPRWLENDLSASEDILSASVDVSEGIFRELWAYGRAKGIPIGCNVESVSTRKVEIDASDELLGRIARIMGRG